MTLAFHIVFQPSSEISAKGLGFKNPEIIDQYINGGKSLEDFVCPGDRADVRRHPMQMFGLGAPRDELCDGGIDAILGATIDDDIDCLSSERLRDRETDAGGRACDEREPVLLDGHLISLQEPRRSKMVLSLSAWLCLRSSRETP
jgi:hypothetical protein